MLIRWVVARRIPDLVTVSSDPVPVGDRLLLEMWLAGWVRGGRPLCGVGGTSGCGPGCSSRLADEALAGYDRIVGLDLSGVAVDASLNKGALRGRGNRPQPGRSRQIRLEMVGQHRPGRDLPLGWAVAPANRNDCILLAPTLDAVAQRGHSQRLKPCTWTGAHDYPFIRNECRERGLTDLVIPSRRPDDRDFATSEPSPQALRWPVERTNSWLTNWSRSHTFSDRRIIPPLRRPGPRRRSDHHHQLSKWANRWNY